MKKKIVILVAAMLCLAVLSGCSCKHEWAEATCKTPKTCTKCQETEGEPIAHNYLDATCTQPKTCQLCGTTMGEPTEHAWIDATCTVLKTCADCGATEGELAEHTWADATTEAPKTCTGCGLTEGGPIVTDPRFTSAAAAPVLGKWACEISATSDMLGMEGFPADVKLTLIIDFGNAGEYTMSARLADEEAFKEAMVQYTMDKSYAELAASGMDKEAADAAVLENMGVTMEEYIQKTVGAMDFNALYDSIFSALNIGGVYYVDGAYLYDSIDWTGEMAYTMFSIDREGKLYVDQWCRELGLDTAFTRIVETEEAETAVEEPAETEAAEETSAAEETTAETEVTEAVSE